MEEKRYRKIVLEAEKGITFEVLEGTNEELNIRALNIVSNTIYLKLPTVSAGECATILSVYTDNDENKAVVPPGWTVSGTKEENTIWGKNEGLVIYRIPQEKVSDIDWSIKQEVKRLQRTYDQLVWVPVEKLDSNGTLDGVSYTEKFGKRNYIKGKFLNETERLTRELAFQNESVKKYGGFYISRYNISKNEKTGKPQSVKDAIPLRKNIDDAKEIAVMFETSDTITSHLTFDAEYDSVLEWFIKSKVRTYSEIATNSSKWGNYFNTKNSPQKMVETGRRKEWCTNNIYDFAGNVNEWTQPQNSKTEGLITLLTRGGSYSSDGYFSNAANRSFKYIDERFIYDGRCDTHTIAGFRVTLYIL